MMNTTRLGSRLVVPLAAALVIGSAAGAAAQVPAQFIAKIYTEALGRVPDRPGYQARADHFTRVGCNVQSLREHGLGVYVSPEYQSLGYDNAAKLLTAYRGILSREPDAAGYYSLLQQLNAGTPFPLIAHAMFVSGEFASLIQRICTFNAYTWGPSPAIAIPVEGPGFQGDDQLLQQALDSAGPGGIVNLAPKALVRLNRTLVIPRGVTLSTFGQPGPNRYAFMGRLVRAPGFTGGAGGQELVRLEDGAQLRNVWVDGQRRDGFNTTGNFNAAFGNYNVTTRGGTGTTVAFSKLSNSAGAGNALLEGSAQNVPCPSTMVAGNVITNYSLANDGIGIGCENAVVEGNQIMDAPDGAIVLFRSADFPQASQIRHNTIVSLGNPVNYGIVVEPFLREVNNLPVYLRPDGSTRINLDFAGSSINNNHIWSGARTFFKFGGLLGTRPLFGIAANIGTGASFTDNTLEGRFNVGIGIAGMRAPFVDRNVLNISGYVQATAFCPLSPISIEDRFDYSSGYVQGPQGLLLPDYCYAGYDDL